MTQRPAVTGIGGVFFKANDPRALANWYHEYLGVPVASDGTHAVFAAHHDGTDGTGSPLETVWSTFPSTTTYFAPSHAAFMTNFRVANLDAMLAQLRSRGVTVDDAIDETQYGRFGWLMDPEGNRIELWQPPAHGLPGSAPADASARTHREHHYRASVAWTGAVAGATTSYQSYSREYEFWCGDKPHVRGSADAAFRGDATLYNPEELLVVALSTCHLLSYLADCARGGVHVVAYEDDASGTMTMRDGKERFVDVLLRPRVTVAQGTDVARAREMHDSAHEGCFIASSVNFPVRHDPTIVVAE
jgi:organic hydroperoxide reductase OsmC/OhrA/predicted enzyme related to lactoylglutathione lyase